MTNETTSKPISIDKIATAPVDVPDSGTNDARKESEFLHQRESFKSELGWLGRPFGGRAEKPGNISALVIVLCFGAMFSVYFSRANLEAALA